VDRTRPFLSCSAVRGGGGGNGDRQTFPPAAFIRWHKSWTKNSRSSIELCSSSLRQWNEFHKGLVLKAKLKEMLR